MSTTIDVTTAHTPTIDYSLGVWHQDDGQLQFEGKVTITEDDWKRYSEAMGRFLTLTERRTLKMVARNALELDTLTGYYRSLYQTRRAPEEGRLDARDAAFNLMTAVVNWLSSFRLYLDHEERRINHTYGETSEQLARFEKVTSEVFDNSAAYRVIYKFRNYVQHCGMPISSVSMKSVDDDSVATQRIEFTVDRDTLLADYDWTVTTRADLADMPKDIDVFDLIRETMDGLRKIAHEVLRIDTERALAGVKDIREARERLGEVDGNPVLLELGVEAGELKRISHLPLLGEADIERLERAAEEDDPLETLASAPQVPTKPSMDEPTRYRIGRAVSLLSTWFEENGANEKYHAHANALISEDRSVEPLLAGMVFVTSYALAIAGGALGTTGQSILGGLTLNGDTDTGG